MTDLSKVSDERLEDMLLDLCGRLTLTVEEVIFLQEVENELERRKTTILEEKFNKLKKEPK